MAALAYSVRYGLAARDEAKTPNGNQAGNNAAADYEHKFIYALIISYYITAHDDGKNGQKLVYNAGIRAEFTPYVVGDNLLHPWEYSRFGDGAAHSEAEYAKRNPDKSRFGAETFYDKRGKKKAYAEYLAGAEEYHKHTFDAKTRNVRRGEYRGKAAKGKQRQQKAYFCLVETELIQE